jgi:hypothetical protein
MPWEYIELRGTPGMSLANHYVVAFEAEFTVGGTAGQADFVSDLTGFSMGSNGLLIVKATSGGFTVPAQTTIVTNPALDTGSSNNLENGSVSYFVISSPTPIVLGLDYDGDDNGVLDLPVGAVARDGVGFAAAGDFTYAGFGLTQTSGSPDGMTRFRDNLKPFSHGAWYNADLVGGPPSGVDYDITKASANMPSTGKLTPGDANSHIQKIVTGGLVASPLAASGQPATSPIWSPGKEPAQLTQADSESPGPALVQSPVMRSLHKQIESVDLFMSLLAPELPTW